MALALAILVLNLSSITTFLQRGLYRCMDLFTASCGSHFVRDVWLYILLVSRWWVHDFGLDGTDFKTSVVATVNYTCCHLRSPLSLGRSKIKLSVRNLVTLPVSESLKVSFSLTQNTGQNRVGLSTKPDLTPLGTRRMVWGSRHSPEL